MIEIASPATPQLSSLFAAAPTALAHPHERGRREKYDPIATARHSLATLYPPKSSLIVIPTARQQTRATFKSP